MKMCLLELSFSKFSP